MVDAQAMITNTKIFVAFLQEYFVPLWGETIWVYDILLSFRVDIIILLVLTDSMAAI